FYITGIIGLYSGGRLARSASEDCPHGAGEGDAPACLRAEAGDAVGTEGRRIISLVALKGLARWEDVLSDDAAGGRRLRCAAFRIKEDDHPGHRACADNLVDMGRLEPVEVLAEDFRVGDGGHDGVADSFGCGHG